MRRYSFIFRCVQEWKRSALAGLASAVLLTSGLASANPTVSTDLPLDFGTLSAQGNATLASLRVDPNGGQAVAGPIIPFGDAQAGVLLLNSFPPFTSLEFEADDAQLSAGGSGLPPYLTVTSARTAAPLTTDDQGMAVLSLGATLVTSGSGTPYGDAVYSGTLSFRLRYWDPFAGQLVTGFFATSARATLRSSIELSEEQALSFGRLVALPHPDGRARMLLSPNGAITVTQEAGARLVPIDQASPGMLQISGAAPFYRLNLILPADPVEMRHTNPNVSSPRFWVRDFTTAPAADSLNTDASGSITVRLGATLETEPSATRYESGSYTGTFTINVSY